MDENNPYDHLFTPEQWAKVNAAREKHWVQVDPVTRKPFASAKECFWSIEHVYPAIAANGGNMNQPDMQCLVQRYWRTKTYQAPTDMGSSSTVTKHEPFVETNARGELIATGSMNMTFDDFQKRFIEESEYFAAKK
jgi:hypothetical protein